MAVKYSRSPVASVPAINNELQKIQVALEDAVSRTGAAPNQLEATLDANSQRIINLPEPVTNTEPVRKADFDELGNKLRSDVYTAVRNAEDATDDAISAANSANAATSNAYQTIADLESDGYAVINKIESDGQSALDALRVVNAGSFEDGATLTARNEVLYYLAEQTYYRWDGALPKTVPSASTPASTGGVGVGAWVDVGDATLRSELSDPDKGAAMVARGVVAVDSIADLLALPEEQRRSDLLYLVKGYHAGSDVGGGEFRFDPARTGENDGIGILDGFVRAIPDLPCIDIAGAPVDAESSAVPSINALADFVGVAGNIGMPARSLLIDETVVLERRNVTGEGQRTNLSVKLPAGGVGLEVSHAPAGRIGKLEGFTIQADGDVDTLMHVVAPRTTLADIRLSTVENSNVSNALLDLHDSWLNLLENVITYSPVGPKVVGLRLGSEANSIDVIGGEYATHGDPIVIDGGRRIKLLTCVEGSGDRGDGLVINGGDTIDVEAYFENKGIRITGGDGIRISGCFITDNAIARITGGRNITFDGALWVTASSPRDAVLIGPGIDHEVLFRQNCSMGDGGTKFVLANSVVRGESVGTNLVSDPTLTSWTEGLPTGLTISKDGGSATLTQSNARQTGAFSLRWDNNSSPGSSVRGIRFPAPISIDEVKGGWVTLGAWVYVPDIEGSDARYRVRLESDGIVEQQSEPTVAFSARLGAWAYFSHAVKLSEDTTTLGVQINVQGTQLGTEWFSLDRYGIFRGKFPQNIPLHI